MITPLIAMNFTTAFLDPRISFTRSGNTATRVNSTGLIESINANLPRFDYSPASLACRGLLIEEPRSNLLLNSVFDGGGAAPTSFTQLLATGTSAPITSTRSLVGVAYAQSATAQRPFIAQNISLTNAVQYTISMVIEETSGLPNSAILTVSGFTMTQYYSNGVAVAANASSTPGILSAVFTNNVGTAAYSCRFGIGVTTTATGTLRFSCPQIEAGAFATSYIPTTTAAVTRNADVATITGTNFSDFWQASKGGVLVRARPGTVSGTRPWVQFDDNTADNIIALRGVNADPQLYIKATTDQATIDAGTIAANTDYALTGWWQTDNCKARLDKGAVVTDTSATIPTVTQARLGSDGTEYLNGHLASISYYDTFSGQIYTQRKNKAVFSLL